MSIYDTYRTILSISFIIVIISVIISVIFIKIEDIISSIKKEHICFISFMVSIWIAIISLIIFISTLFMFKFNSHKYNRSTYDIDTMIKDYNIIRTEYSSEVNKSNADYIVKYSAFGHEEWIHFIKRTEDTDKYLIKDK